MNKNDYTIRLEKKEEYREVENLVRESFWNVYRPGCLEHYVLNQLRDNSAFAPELDFVMERAAFHMPAITAYVTMDFRKVQMHRFSYAKS